MIKVFSAEQYMEEQNIEKLPEPVISLLEQIISLEISIFHMVNTNKPKFCDGYNIDIIRNLRNSKIVYFESISKLSYTSLNDFED